MMADDEYIIQTKYCESFDFVFMKKDELSYENYVFQAANVFKVNRDLEFKVKLKTNNNFLLTKSNFNRIVQYYSHCACFQITVQMDVKQMSDAIINAEVIENYLIDNNVHKAVLEEREGSLSVSTRRTLIGHLAEFAISLYGLDVSRVKLVPFCEAVLDVFPSLNLGTATEKNIDLLTSKNGNGFLAAKIKYIKKQKRQSQTASIGDECCSDAEDQGIVEESSSQPSSCQEDLEFLKIAVVNSDNMNIIKAKLAATSKYRRDLISAKHSIDLLENFPYFFYNAELVEFEFSNIYRSIESNCFLAAWRTYGPKLNDLMRKHYPSQLFATKWPAEIENFLILLKLFPLKPIGRNNTATVMTFKNSINKLIVFNNKDGLPDKIKENDHPYIIACGKSQKELTHFYIEVEKHLVNVPRRFNAIETFDFFFKIHKIFNLKFDPQLQNMMKYVEHCLYSINNKKNLPSGMLEIHNKIK